MDNWRLADPEYTNFEPKTVSEAILRFRRLQKQGLSAWMYPECFIQCAAKLPPAELDKFEAWLVSPSGEPSETVFAKAAEDWKNAKLPSPPVDVTSP